MLFTMAVNLQVDSNVYSCSKSFEFILMFTAVPSLLNLYNVDDHVDATITFY